MNSLKVLLAMLVLTIAACRTVPSEVATQHSMSVAEANDAMELASVVLTKIDAKAADFDSLYVYASYEKWKDHLVRVSISRNRVLAWLKESKAGPDVIGPYRVAEQLLIDMNNNFHSISNWWHEMVDPVNDLQAKEFVALFRKDIKRFRVLERKFDDWISQFKVKG